MQTPEMVLTVDDDARNLRLLNDLLTHAGYDVRRAENGPEALAAAEHSIPDLVLLDIGLPGMDGYEVLRRLRQLPSMEAVPVVALTAHVTTADRSRIREAGFDGFVGKPLVIDTLYEAVRSAIDRRDE